MPLPPFHTYQNTAVDFALAKSGTNCFARPGKGKTRIALDTIYHTGERTLILSPLFPALKTWRQENKKWGYDFDMRVLHGKEKKPGTEDVTVINYDAIPWLCDQDLSSYKYIIYDEVHYLKHAGTGRFRKWRKRMKQFEFRLGLTGTPVGNNLKDLWGEMYCVDLGETLGRTLSGFGGFHQTFCLPHPHIPHQWVFRDDMKDEIMQRIKPNAIALDFLDGEMPELIHNAIPISLPKVARDLYTQMQKKKIVADTDVIAVNAGVQSNKLRQMAAGNVYDHDGNIVKVHKEKQKALKRLVDELQGEPLIVFFEFAHDKTSILEELGDVPFVDGSTNINEVSRIVDEWNAGKIPVLAAHPKVLGVGGNMQESGNQICFYTPPWSLGDIEQAIGRVWRQGQKAKGVTVHYLVCECTKDEDVLIAVEGKSGDQNELFKQLR